MIEFVSPFDTIYVANIHKHFPWLFKTEGSLCFICEENTETVFHHFIECPPFRNYYNSLWSNLKTKIINFNQTDGITISDFITNLDPHKKVLLLLGELSLPFDDASVVLIKRSVASAVGKIHKLRTAKLRELEAPWGNGVIFVTPTIVSFFNFSF